MGRQYNIVCLTPRNPRRWDSQLLGERSTADVVAAQLLGAGAAPQQFGNRLALSPQLLSDRQDASLVGVQPFDYSVFVVWTGVPSTALRWDRLECARSWDRYEVGLYPASKEVEVRWVSAAGEVRRHVDIVAGEVAVNVGDGQVVDETADDDPTLNVDRGFRLPAAIVKQLIKEAEPDQMSTYDGRRYVRTDDAAILAQARIVRTDRRGQRWVAVDQKGLINTLRDPLATVPAGGSPFRGDVEDLADRVLQAWFGFAMARLRLPGPPLALYAWPDDRYRGVEQVLPRLRQDPTTFFSLLAQAVTEKDAIARLSQHYDLAPDDAATLLDRPTRLIWPQPARNEPPQNRPDV